MSWIDTITDNAIKAGQAIGICDSAELRKLKDDNEKHKIEIEKQTRTDEFVKNHSKTVKELDEMRPSYESVVLYEAYSTGNLAALKELLKPKKHKPDAATTDANTDVEVDNVEVPAND